MVQLYRSFKVTLKKIIGACCLLVTINQQATAQQATITLSSPNTSGTYVATQRITLDNGFSALGTTGFNAYIAPSAIVNCNSLSATPSSDRNYVQTLTPRQPFTDASTLTSKSTCEVMQAIQYLDGLGRPIQTVQVKGNPDATKDLIQPQAYDQFDREPVKYLSYTTSAGTAGSYRTDALTPGSGVFSFYNPTGTGTSGSQQNNGIVVIPAPSSSTVFEPSPLNRPLEQGAPGDAWQPAASRTTTGRTVVMDYQVNNNITWAADPTNSFQVALYSAMVNSDGTRILSRASTNTVTYDAGQLMVNIVKDGNWTSGRAGTSETYTDKMDHVVLKRTYNMVSGTVQVLSTYYVYDDLNELAFVLPPGVNPDFNTNIDQTALNTWCYQYRYDLKQRLVEKRIPGKGWEYTVYNALDQAVATQDANQQANGQWMVTKYDALGRAVVTGIWNSSATRITLQGSVDGQTTQWENKDNGQTYGYTLTNTYPATLNQVLSVNYYDDYNIAGLPNTYDKHASFSADTKGLSTASQVNVLGTTDMLWTVTYYDSKGRAAEIYKQHYLGGTANTANYDVITNIYDFTNAVTSTNRMHYTSSSYSNPALTIANTYVYDHIGRKLQSWEQINGGTNTVISQEDYNEVGQLKTKHLHSADNGSTYLQNVDYTYNERGWLRTSGTSLNTAPTNLLNFELKYNNASTPQYNGNIGQMNYLTTHVTNAGNRSFNYSYDALNRLTNAAFTGGLSSDALDEAISYDVMGNITQIVRNGTGAGTLNYTSYTGNQLNTVTGYSARNYTYDPNGNATSEGTGKGISYNLLNLPQIVSNGTTVLATYTYGANGDKLRNTGSDGTWDYVGGIVYDTPIGGTRSISFIQTEEGRAALNSGVYNYEYNLKDHLGNNRVSIDQYGGVVRVIQEDEYYSFGLRKPTGGYDLSNNNRYLYNGKEIQTDLTNQYDYGARFYDPVIARWSGVDQLSEKFFNYSPYNYVAGNPISLIDPDGRSITDTGRGVKFDSSDGSNDAAEAFNVVTGKTKNVYVDIENDPANRNSENNAPPGWSGSWSVFATKNFATANAALSAFHNKSLSNLVLETHGGHGLGESEIRIDDLDQRNKANNTDAHLIKGCEMTEFTLGINSEKVNELRDITDKVADGGRFILAACSVGDGDMGKEFGAALNDLSGNRLNIYLPTGLISTPTQKLPGYGNILGMQQPNFFQVANSPGWLQVSPNGSYSNIRSIFLSPYANTPPIKITK